MISIDGLAVEFSGTTLFSDISFVINEKDRIALMGKNGAGKSTLLKILAGVRQPTRGKVSAPKDCVVAYLPQHLMTEDGRTVFAETAQAFAHLHEMEARIDALNKELETRTDYESDSYMALIEEVSALSEKFYSIDATNYEEDVEKSLLGLGFTREDFQRQTSDFSGGWRMRIELAKLLLQKPDVLLLDEPTNHLDIESIQWLEDFLINNGKAVIVISHDRKFVDNITTRTIEVTMGRIYDYKVNYSQYLQLRKERREQQQKAYDEQQKFIAETEAFIERFKGTYSKTLQVQSRVKMLEKLELLELMKDDEQDEAPDILKASSQVLMNIFKEYGPETLPEYIRVLSLEDYFSEKVTGSYAIKTIQNAWKTSKDSFEIYPRTNELCYNAGATYEADRILKELPETLEVRKSRDCLMMNLEEAQKFFGITFKKSLFPWLSKIFA